jgi:hypothetical protein
MPMSTPQQLLERYVEAKDFTRPALMREIYRSDAVLTYAIATDDIRFPARVEGIEAITRTLVSDFALSFDRCRTYYVCDAPPGAAQHLAFVPWLVVMRERDVGLLRMGQGFYRWGFEPDGEGALRAATMHIHIHRMDRIQDPRAELLEAVQHALPYPWLTPAFLRDAFEARSRSRPDLAFVREFAAPLPPESGSR